MGYVYVYDKQETFAGAPGGYNTVTEYSPKLGREIWYEEHGGPGEPTTRIVPHYAVYCDNCGSFRMKYDPPSSEHDIGCCGLILSAVLFLSVVGIPILLLLTVFWNGIADAPRYQHGFLCENCGERTVYRFGSGIRLSGLNPRNYTAADAQGASFIVWEGAAPEEFLKR